MEYKRFSDAIVVRIDRGEEITEQITAVAKQEGVLLASVEALGATDDFTVGAYHPAEKRYQSNRFCGDFEIVSLIGTITQKDGAPYLHLHMSAADDTGRTVGGHLNSARVSVTCEMVIRPIDGTVDRRMNPEIGINLMRF